MWKRGGRVVNGDFQRTPEFREKPHRAHGYLEFHGMCEYRIVFFDAQEMVAGSFMVASQCPTCNSGYALDQIVFTGFDKNQNNAKESFFIINKTDRELTGVSLYIEYITPDRRQLHKRFLKLTCSIPAGETRKADIQSWDTQKSFYYYKSNPSKRKGNPFDVKFDIIAYYLRAD